MLSRVCIRLRSARGVGQKPSEATKELDSAQVRQVKIGDAASDPKTPGPTENLREKAAKTIDENEDSDEPT
jgi:hypothetical protein